VAQEGLGIEGRDALLLRSQLLAYRALPAAPTPWREQAAAALRIYERDSEAPHVRDLCSRADEVCRTDRTQLAVRWLKAGSSARARATTLLARRAAR